MKLLATIIGLIFIVEANKISIYLIIETKVMIN